MEDDARIDEILDCWEEAEERGQVITVEELCGNCPDLLPDVKQKIAALKEMNSRLKTRKVGEDTTDEETPTGDGARDVAVESQYSDLAFHAKGGLGCVYVADDKRLHRSVALKFIHGRLAGDKESRERFALEAEVTSRLEHPGVVPVYGMGETAEGRMFYAMRFIEGETLKAAIDRFHKGENGAAAGGVQSVEFHRLLQRFVSVCKTIAYAHNRGIVHCDIKPENVMLGRFGETLVVDWGLVVPVSRDERFKKSGEKTLMPSSGSGSGDLSGRNAGTPSYMSRERMEGADPTPAGDIYSLGVTLYAILTGKTPFEGQKPLEIRHNAIHGEYPRPSLVGSNVPPALEAVCLKAMALAATDRYEMALDLARDVEHYLADEPVSVYREPRSQKIARWTRRHRSTAQAAVTGLLAVIVITIVSAIWLASLASSRREAYLTAESAREQGLRVAAKFAARTVAGEVDVRWRILEAEAKAPKVRQWLQEINKSPTDASLREPLQAWLNERYIAQNQTTRAQSWFINAQDGTQVARTPMRDDDGKISESLGKNYSYRDYFHGQGHDLPADQTEHPQPLEQNVYMSAVFESTTTRTMKVAFSTPIRGEPTDVGEGEPIGVFVMSVELGEFAILETDLAGGQIAMLVDSDADELESEPKSGLVLHHPKLGLRSKNDLPPRLDDVFQTHAENIRQMRREQEKEGQADILVRNFRDPVIKDRQGPWLAAFEAVLVKGRPREIADTGWTVIIEQVR